MVNGLIAKDDFGVNIFLLNFIFTKPSLETLTILNLGFSPNFFSSFCLFHAHFVESDNQRAILRVILGIHFLHESAQHFNRGRFEVCHGVLQFSAEEVPKSRQQMGVRTQSQNYVLQIREIQFSRVLLDTRLYSSPRIAATVAYSSKAPGYVHYFR